MPSWLFWLVNVVYFRRYSDYAATVKAQALSRHIFILLGDPPSPNAKEQKFLPVLTSLPQEGPRKDDETRFQVSAVDYFNFIYVHLVDRFRF